MNSKQTPDKLRHPIGIVSMRSGIPQELIRAWERRYQAVQPQRGPTGRRVYTDQDIERLKLLKRVVGTGRRISDVAGLSTETLRQLVVQDLAEMPEADQVQSVPENPHDRSTRILADCLTALEALDRQRLEQLLADAAVELSGPHLRQKLIVPLLYTVGERWRDGSLRIVHEHMVTAIVQLAISAMLGNTLKTGPRILITTPAGQLHELGALLAAAAAVEVGCDVIYLGPNMPAEEIAAGARQVRADAVALSVVYKDNDLALHQEIARLRSYLDPKVPIIIGGRAAVSLGARLADSSIQAFSDLQEFQDYITSLGV